VAVAAILVASIRLHCVADAFNRNYRGRSVIDCERPVRKGEELGWFEHGSTIIVFAPDGFALCEPIRDGAALRVGEPLMRLP
jgi:phosphatidylserine decarboxylase